MAAKLTNANLLQISKSNATTITNFRLGVHLSSTSGRSIDELTEAACRDRLAFARRTLSYARTTMRGAKPQYRVALARSYYAMYHAARAVVYFIKRGDDHEAHSELPKYIPTDFPNRDQWENELKAARFERNDAALINLDVTLEQPAKAKEFLSSILRSYTDEAKLGSILGVISREALDRLVLASGGVPRDFLLLSATAIQVARQRANAKTTGVQDVNEAAGSIARIKLQELEDDAASAVGMARARTDTLNTLREFLLEDKQVTYFRVDFRDKETRTAEYDLLQSVMDLRLTHLINASLSDERHAGHRSEVYMLDLSQFSGTRFKRNLKVLDFTRSYLVLKHTGGEGAPRPGDTPKKLQSILRRGPLFPLADLTGFTA